MRDRSRIEIVAQILEVVDSNGGDSSITKTSLMNRVFCSPVPLREYLSLLTESNLLQYDGLTLTYRITEKGRKFLHKFDQIDQALNLRQQFLA